MLCVRAVVQADVSADEPRRRVPPEERGVRVVASRPSGVVLQEEVRSVPKALFRLEVPQEARAGGAREAEALHLPRVQPPVVPEGHDGDAHEAAHRREALRVRRVRLPDRRPQLAATPQGMGSLHT